MLTSVRGLFYFAGVTEPPTCTSRFRGRNCPERDLVPLKNHRGTACLAASLAGCHGIRRSHRLPRVRRSRSSLPPRLAAARQRLPRRQLGRPARQLRRRRGRALGPVHHRQLRHDLRQVPGDHRRVLQARRQHGPAPGQPHVRERPLLEVVPGRDRRRHRQGLQGHPGLLGGRQRQGRQDRRPGLLGPDVEADHLRLRPQLQGVLRADERAVRLHLPGVARRGRPLAEQAPVHSPRPGPHRRLQVQRGRQAGVRRQPASTGPGSPCTTTASGTPTGPASTSGRRTSRSASAPAPRARSSTSSVPP